MDKCYLEDEEIISRFLKRVIVNGDSWPEDFLDDFVDVFNENPYREFNPQFPEYAIVKPRTEACGKTDGCDEGCWRIIGRDKLIKSKETGKILGFKTILKFCLKTKPREYKRSYVMEEYRLTSNLNWKQDHVICKIRLLFEAEISELLSKHFTTTSESLLLYKMLPNYGSYFSSQQEEDEGYLMKIKKDSGGNDWPSYVTNKVYRLNPLMLVNPLDTMFKCFGICIFANETLGTTDKFDGGYWRILQRERPIKIKGGTTIGFKKVLYFDKIEKQRYGCDQEEEYVKVTWMIQEYRLNEKLKQNKLLCVIKLQESLLFSNDS